MEPGKDSIQVVEDVTFGTAQRGQPRAGEAGLVPSEVDASEREVVEEVPGAAPAVSVRHEVHGGFELQESRPHSFHSPHEARVRRRELNGRRGVRNHGASPTVSRSGRYIPKISPD